MGVEPCAEKLSHKYWLLSPLATRKKENWGGGGDGEGKGSFLAATQWADYDLSQDRLTRIIYVELIWVWHDSHHDNSSLIASLSESCIRQGHRSCDAF